MERHGILRIEIVKIWPQCRRQPVAAVSFRLHDQINDRCFTDILDFVPIDAGARKAASRCQVDFARAAGVSDSHSAAGNRVAKVTAVKMPLVAGPGREAAAQNPLLRILVETFADRTPVPTGLKRIREVRLCGECYDDNERYTASPKRSRPRELHIMTRLIDLFERRES